MYKKPEPSPIVTYYELTYAGRSEKEILKLLATLHPIKDRDMLEVIFKRCEYHAICIHVGKIIYYDQ